MRLLNATNKIKNNNHFKFATWSFECKNIVGMLARKDKSAIVRLFLNLRIVAGGSISKDLRSLLYRLFSYLNHIRRTQGVKGLVLYLKVCGVVTQQSVCGHKLDNLTLLGPRVKRSRSGLPDIIPSGHRRIILNRLPGWEVMLRFYLTIFSMYRVIPLTGKMDTSTITSPGPSLVSVLRMFKRYIPRFVNLTIEPINLRTFWNQTFRFVSIFKSSPTTGSVWGTAGWIEQGSKARPVRSTWSTHPLQVLQAWYAWNAPANEGPFSALVKLGCRYAAPMIMFMKGLTPTFHIPGTAGVFTHGRIPSEPGIRATPILGALGLKVEAAMKVRIFAMVDPFTQWLLRPLHKFLFRNLRKLKMDGTFEQLRPVERLLSLHRNKGLFSLDLSAATDRLPVALQSLLLDYLEGQGMSGDPWKGTLGQLWADLLTNRDYIYPGNESIAPFRVRYAVGQPMGALSSWAMLAWTHHLIIQVAAWQSGYSKLKLFTHYAILGDDIVIGIKKVSAKYLELLKMLGVKVGLPKSILSPKAIGLEFAKSTFVYGVNVSPVSLKETQAALGTITDWVTFARKWNLTYDASARVLGHGYRARNRSFRRSNHALQLVILASIAKTDFQSQDIQVSRGAPKEFNEVHSLIMLDKFVVPLQTLILQKLELLQDLSDNYLDNVYDQVGLEPYPALQDWMDAWGVVFKHELIGHINTLNLCLGMTMSLQDSLPNKKVLPFNDMLSGYVGVITELATVNIEHLRLRGVAPSASTALPLQIRLFRFWSRLSTALVKQYRVLHAQRSENALIKWHSKESWLRSIMFTMSWPEGNFEYTVFHIPKGCIYLMGNVFLEYEFNHPEWFGCPCSLLYVTDCSHSFFPDTFTLIGLQSRLMAKFKKVGLTIVPAFVLEHGVKWDPNNRHVILERLIPEIIGSCEIKRPISIGGMFEPSLWGDNKVFSSTLKLTD